MNGNGLITKLYTWIFAPYNDDSTTVADWFGALLLVLVANFLWATVVRQTIE